MKAWPGAIAAVVCAAIALSSGARERSEVFLPVSSLAGLPIGTVVQMRGARTTNFDGTQFDAAARFDLLPDGTRVAKGYGFFDLEAGGLTIVRHDPERHETTLRVSSHDTPACAAQGESAPCLVSRARILARERLLTTDELEQSLSGAIDVTSARLPNEGTSTATGVAWLCSAFASLMCIGVVVRDRRASPRYVTRRLAGEARARASQDPSLAVVRVEIDALVAEADRYSRMRDLAEKALRQFDDERERELRARAADTTSAEGTRIAAERELAELERLRVDLRASQEGLERVHATLRTIALAARDGRGLTPSAHDASAAVHEALKHRDAAKADVDSMFASR